MAHQNSNENFRDVPPPLQQPRRAIDWSKVGNGMEVRVFVDDEGRSYIVHRYLRPNDDGFSYHVFMEVETQKSARFFSNVDRNHEGDDVDWWRIWFDHTAK